MPGYTIVTTEYKGNKPMFFQDISTDGITENIVYYTDQPSVDSVVHCNSSMHYRLASQDKDTKIVGMCVGHKSPDWLTKENNSKICYIRRRIISNEDKKIYQPLPMLYRTLEDASKFTPSTIPNHSYDIVIGYLAHSEIVFDD
jgi:hypothetical protein